jgi:glyoxylase-like metal-dependent hydrolase (beta-lactamase superfamily II)
VAYVALTERVGYVPGGVNIGVVRGESGHAIMIDTGIGETNGKKALKSIREALGSDVSAIVTTHGHADHFGANLVVVKRTGAKVYAPTIDEVFLRYPMFQPSSLFGGADPLDALRGGFLLADASPVDAVYDAGSLVIDGVELEVIDLSGHSPGQKGLLIDGVFFCADVVLPESVLTKYRIPYLYSVTQHLIALDTAAEVTCQIAVPGHGAITEDLTDLINMNRSLVHQVIDVIVSELETPQTAEALLTRVLCRLDAPISDAPGYYLLQPTVFAFLSHLEREGVVTHAIAERQSIWSRASS